MRDLTLTVALVATLLAPVAVEAQTRESVLVDTATTVFQEIMTIPERSIPPALLQGSQAVAIVPGVIKAGFLIGGRFGRGLVVVRDASGAWSNPVFVTLGGGSFGFQAGAQASDLVLVFRNRGSLDGFLANQGKFTLGADASAAAGPVGRNMGAATDAMLKSEILTYSRSRGLFAGVSLDGSALSLDWQATTAYYGKVVSPGDVLSGAVVNVPASAGRLKAWLNHYSGAPPVQAAPAPDPGQQGPTPDGPMPVLRSSPASSGAMSEPDRAGGSAWRRPSGSTSSMSSSPVTEPVAGTVVSTTAPPPKVLRSEPTGGGAVLVDPGLAPASSTVTTGAASGP